jgi:hypothetical protein
MLIYTADADFSISRFQYRECHAISTCRLSEFTVSLRSFPHYETDNTPYSLKLGGFLEVFQIDQARSHSNLPVRHRCLGGLLGSWPAFLLSAVLQRSDGLV